MNIAAAPLLPAAFIQTSGPAPELGRPPGGKHRRISHFDTFTHHALAFVPCAQLFFRFKTREMNTQTAMRTKDGDVVTVDRGRVGIIGSITATPLRENRAPVTIFSIFKIRWS